VRLIDAHNHLGRWLSPAGRWLEADLAGGVTDLPWTVPDAPALIDLLDRSGVEAVVNLDGRWGAELEANLDRYDRAHPGRVFTFCQLDWSLARQGDDFGERLAASLERSVAAGARGLKVWKTLGLGWTDARGRWLLPDDARIGPVWETAAALSVPVLVHTADPPAFFEPVDDRNPWRSELLANPDWSYHGRGLPAFARLIDAFEALVEAHPTTTFIGAHGIWLEDDEWLLRILGSCANLHIDLSARMPQLAARRDALGKLLAAHPDRVLFGTDEFPPEAEVYASWRRFLGGPALGLADDALQMVCGENARRVLTRAHERRPADAARSR